MLCIKLCRGNKEGCDRRLKAHSPYSTKVNVGCFGKEKYMAVDKRGRKLPKGIRQRK